MNTRTRTLKRHLNGSDLSHALKINPELSGKAVAKCARYMRRKTGK